MKMSYNETLKRVVLKYFFWLVRFFEYIRISFQNWDTNPPIIIYSLGKTGSTSVYKSIKKSGIKNPVFHVHTLNPANLAASVAHIKQSKDKYLGHVTIVQDLLIRKLRRHPKTQLLIITLTREPVGQALSSWFQNSTRWVGNIMFEDSDEAYEIVKAEVLNAMRAQLNGGQSHPEWWFKTELNKILGIDVFCEPFDYEQKYKLFINERARCLLMRMEDLNGIFSVALTRLLGDEGFSIDLARANTGVDKWYAEWYQRAKSDYKHEMGDNSSARESRYVNHFYSDM